MHAAQICRNEELIPKDLFHKISNVGTVRPIIGPAIYKGQGSFIISNIEIDLLFNYFFLFKLTENKILNRIERSYMILFKRSYQLEIF